jgi:transcriptional regulator with XRE-family HTH domain
MAKHRDFSKLRTWLPSQIAAYNQRGEDVLTLEKLAHRIGKSRTALYRYLYDDDRPTTQTMNLLCQALGVSLTEGLRQYTPKKLGRPRLHDDKGQKVKK